MLTNLERLKGHFGRSISSGFNYNTRAIAQNRQEIHANKTAQDSITIP